MESPVKVMGHSPHPILIVFPLGLLGASVVFEILYYLTNKPDFALVTFWLIVGGLVGGAMAAPFGWIDWFAIPAETRAKRVGLTHGLTFVTVLVLFAVSGYLRWKNGVIPTMLESGLIFVGFGLSMLGGWLGGELVERLGIAVHEGADVDAPSSLSVDPPILPPRR